jgi:porphobilinogen synthase
MTQSSYPSTRLRRNRKAPWARALVAENILTAADLIWPIFVIEGQNKSEVVGSMPGVFRYSIGG